MNRLRACPFCKKRLEDGVCLGVHYNQGLDKWLLDHWCNQKDATMGVIITVYGKTEQEVIDKWNGDYEE